MRSPILLCPFASFPFSVPLPARPPRRRRLPRPVHRLGRDGERVDQPLRVGLRDGERPLANYVVDLGQAGEFRFAAYRRAQTVGTAWLAARLPAMHAFVVAHLRAHRGANDRRLEHPERTLASYVFQEAEGVSRAAKLWWARARGHAVHSLQHDGVVIGLDALAADAHVAQRELNAVCSHALGYEQPVETK